MSWGVKGMFGFTVESSNLGDGKQITVCGELDLYTVNEVKRTASELGNTLPLLADLIRVPFIDGAGIGWLIREHKARDGRLFICASRQVVRMLSILKLEGTLRLYDSLEQARQALSSL